jgi:hypothetical protein
VFFELPSPRNAQKRTKNKFKKNNILGLVGSSKVNQIDASPLKEQKRGGGGGAAARARARARARAPPRNGI